MSKTAIQLAINEMKKTRHGGDYSNRDSKCSQETGF